MKLIGRFLLVACWAVWTCEAQQEKQLEFDAVLIHPSPLRSSAITRIEGGPGTPDPGRFRVTAMNMTNLVSYASGISYQFIEGPNWMTELRYDLTATMPAETTKDQFRAMMREMLVQRFGLRWHLGKVEADGYRLIVEKTGLLTESNPRAEEFAAQPGANPTTDQDGFTGAPIHSGLNFANALGRVRVQAIGVSINEFAQLLAGQMRRPIVDATGLSGKYDFKIVYTTDWLSGRPPSGKEHEFAPDVFSVVSRQLGLKLERGKVIVDQLIVDHIERTPTDN